MKGLFSLLLFFFIFFHAAGQDKLTWFDNSVQGTYTISAGHVSVIDSKYKDTAFLNCYLKVLNTGHCNALDKSGFIIINGKKYQADSTGCIQIRLPQGHYKLTAGSSYKSVPGSIKTRRFFYSQHVEYYLYFYLIETGRY